MINGYLILGKSDFGFIYYKKKIFNIIRILIIWSAFGFFYSLLLKGDSLYLALRNTAKVLIGHYIVPTWFLFTFVVIYTILLFGFNRIKKNIVLLTISLGLICIFIHFVSLYQIYNGGYFIQANVPQRWRLWTWMFYFFLGYCVRLLKEGNRKRTLLSEKRVGIWCIVFSIIAIYLQYQICFVRLGKMNSEYLYDAPIIIVWSLSVFLTILNLKVSNKAEKMVSTIAGNMFGIFLVHEWINDYFALTTLPTSAMSSTLIWLLLFIVSYVVSALVIKFGGKYGKMFITY